VDHLALLTARGGGNMHHEKVQLEDLLSGVVNDVNAAAVKCGVAIGMSGRDALDLM